MTIAVFARAPVAGLVKTRLAKVLGDARAAELYAAFVVDTLAACASAGLETTLWVAGDPDHPALVTPRGIARCAQPDGDLGARMAAALEAGIERAGHALVVGSDAPTLPADYLVLASHWLATGEADVVLGPAADGGFYLAAARRPVRMFERVRWSARTTLAETAERARAHGARVALLPPWYDVDEPEDLRLLRVHLALAPESAPATARELSHF